MEMNTEKIDDEYKKKMDLGENVDKDIAKDRGELIDSLR